MSAGNVQRGEWVIVSGAAGGVGQAAIRLAHAKGARVVALVKDASERWVSPSDAVAAVAQSDRGDLADVVRGATAGHGANLALNGVGAPILGVLLEALGAGGRQVVYSAAGGREFSLDIFSFYRKELRLLGLNTQPLDAARCARILDDLTPLFESGALPAPAIAERYPIDQAAEAYLHVASGKPGKVVLVFRAQ